MSALRPAVLRWLLDGDPAIRWQVLRDLSGAPPEEVAAERARVAVEGWGAALLARQAPTGQWGEADDEGWMTTVEALQLMTDLGVDPAGEPARRAVGLVAERIAWWQLDGGPFFDGETEPCINGRILAAGATYGVMSEALVERLLGEQLSDGGWNCDAPPSRRASFHSTICVLEGLLAVEEARGADPALSDARRKGEDYLLNRHLLRALSTGELIDRRWRRFAFPVTWRYDALRALDYLRRAGVRPDERVHEAIAVVRARRHQNGRWPMNRVLPDRVGLVIEPAVGRASRWNTLRALRVLAWHEGFEAPTPSESGRASA